MQVAIITIKCLCLRVMSTELSKNTETVTALTPSVALVEVAVRADV